MFEIECINRVVYWVFVSVNFEFQFVFVVEDKMANGFLLVVYADIAGIDSVFENDSVGVYDRLCDCFYIVVCLYFVICCYDFLFGCVVCYVVVFVFIFILFDNYIECVVDDIVFDSLPCFFESVCIGIEYRVGESSVIAVFGNEFNEFW